MVRDIGVGIKIVNVVQRVHVIFNLSTFFSIGLVNNNTRMNTWFVQKLSVFSVEREFANHKQIIMSSHNCILSSFHTSILLFISELWNTTWIGSIDLLRDAKKTFQEHIILFLECYNIPVFTTKKKQRWKIRIRLNFLRSFF